MFDDDDSLTKDDDDDQPKSLADRLAIKTDKIGNLRSHKKIKGYTF